MENDPPLSKWTVLALFLAWLACAVLVGATHVFNYGTGLSWLVLGDWTNFP